MSNALRGHLYDLMDEEQQAQARKAALDSAVEPAMDSAAKYETMTARMEAAAAINQWIEDGDLDDGEQLSDRLLALMVGIADDDQEGELEDDEQEVMVSALEAAWDYLSMMGVDDEDLDLLLNEWDADAAVRVHDLVSASMEADATDDEMDNFVFGEEAQEAVFDAVYRKKVAVRGGKKVRINKRVGGNVRLSGKQKVAIRKAQRKARSAGAKVRRMKSMKVRRKLGL